MDGSMVEIYETIGYAFLLYFGTYSIRQEIRPDPEERRSVSCIGTDE
jgi:hypothetical protein